MSIGKRIKEIRTEKKLTIKEFAASLCVDGKTIDRGNFSRYENDVIKPSSDFFLNILKVYSVNLNWLLSGLGEKYVENIDKHKRRIRRAGIINKTTNKFVL